MIFLFGAIRYLMTAQKTNGGVGQNRLFQEGLGPVLRNREDKGKIARQPGEIDPAQPRTPAVRLGNPDRDALRDENFGKT